MKIRPPTIDASHPDYKLAVEEAIDQPLRELVDMAMNVGWQPEDVYTAIANVTTAQIIAYGIQPDPADDPI